MGEMEGFYHHLLGLSWPWRVQKVQLDLPGGRVDVWLEDAPGAQWLCPQCRQPAPLYDHAPEAMWRHLDTCQCRTYVHARLPRTQCPVHGVHQVVPSWADSGAHLTMAFESRVIDTLQECDVTGAGRLTGLSWDGVWRVLDSAVTRGLARKPRRVPALLGIDEKSFAKRHRYETLVCDLSRGTVEYIADDRTQASLESYYQQFTPEELAGIQAVTMDMWDPYIAATRRYVPAAEEKIVFDHFHVTRYVTNAVDKVRRQEHQRLRKAKDERLKGTKHLWLANEENVPEWRREEFAALRAAELLTGRAWAIKESFRDFWRHAQAESAASFFRRWYFWATHSRLAPIIAAAKTIKVHLANILTYFKHRLTNATVEGLNSKIQMVKEMACGFRNREHYKTVIYFHCGGLDLYPLPAPAEAGGINE